MTPGMIQSRTTRLYSHTAWTAARTSLASHQLASTLQCVWGCAITQATYGTTPCQADGGSPKTMQTTRPSFALLSPLMQEGLTWKQGWKKAGLS